jgi:sulfopyruvate decarboxylase subunit alpha
MVGQTNPARPVLAETLYDAVKAAGVTDIVAVPDTHVRSLIKLMRERDEMRFIQTATEDEAITLAAGLVVGGRRPLVQIQHAGLFACVNHLRGVAIEGQFPMLFMIGLLNRDPEKAPRDNFDSMVRHTEPLLDVFDVPYYLLDGPEDVGQIEIAMQQALDRKGPVAVLIGDQTA